MEMYNETQLTKNKMDLNNRKMTNHPPSPGPFYNWWVGTKMAHIIVQFKFNFVFTTEPIITSN